jgi:HlyD family secretion protein
VVLENKEQRKIIIGLKDYVKVEVLSGLDTNAILIKPTQ